MTSFSLLTTQKSEKEKKIWAVSWKLFLSFFTKFIRDWKLWPKWIQIDLLTFHNKKPYDVEKYLGKLKILGSSLVGSTLL